MRILRIQPPIDTRVRYNYKVNYGVWDCIDSYQVIMNLLPAIADSWIENFDVVFMPMFKRWVGHSDQLERLKSLSVKTVLFDNDSCYRLFSDPFYEGIDFIFYRCLDKDGNAPNTPSFHLPWSVDPEYFKPAYGGHGVSFNCTVRGGTYSLRQQIAKHITPTGWMNRKYVSHLQNSAAAIHTNSEIARVPRAKILEFAACGTQIISNRMEGVSDYFPEELITYFETVPELLDIVRDFRPNVEIQKELRKIVEERHSDQIRADEVIEILKNQIVN